MPQRGIDLLGTSLAISVRLEARTALHASLECNGPTVLILTHGGALSNLPLFLAIDAGILAIRGVDAQVPPLRGFGSTARALRDGTAAIGTTGFSQVLVDADLADPLVVVAGSGLRGIALVGRSDVTIETLSGPVGTFEDDPMQVFLADVLARHGLEERVEIRSLHGLAEAAECLADGRLQAITTVEPWIGMLQGRGFAILGDGTQVWGADYPDTVLVTRRSFLDAEPHTVTGVVAAMLDAERMIASDPTAALEMVAHRFPLFSPSQLLAGLLAQPPRVDLRGLEHTILGRWPTVRRLVGRPATPVPAHLIDFRCLAAAVDGTAPSPPACTHIFQIINDNKRSAATAVLPKHMN